MNVNPTRQELLELKERLERARTGHKLLEDKLESLMQEFLQRIKKIRQVRRKIEEQLPKTYFKFMRVSNIIGSRQIDSLCSSIPALDVKTTQQNIVGVKTTHYEPVNSENVLDVRFGDYPPSYFIKETHRALENTFEDLIEYGRLEQDIRALAGEITTTRRRVNALEHVFIPRMEQTADYITQKLEESERFQRALLMKLKDQIV